MIIRLFGFHFSVSTPWSRKRVLRHPKTSRPAPQGNASREFWDAFSSSSTLVATCDACGRTHFVGNGREVDYEPDELEGLLEQEKAAPDRFIADHDNDAIGLLNVGLCIPWNCPCRTDAKYERVFWELRKNILDYYSRRLSGLTRRHSQDYAEARRVEAEVKLHDS